MGVDVGVDVGVDGTPFDASPPGSEPHPKQTTIEKVAAARTVDGVVSISSE
jgi:hypothetical protein